MLYIQYFAVRASYGKGIFFWIQVVEQLLKSKEVRSILTSGEPQKTDPPLHLASKAGHVEIVRFVHSFISLFSILNLRLAGACVNLYSLIRMYHKAQAAAHISLRRE